MNFIKLQKQFNLNNNYEIIDFSQKNLNDDTPLLYCLTHNSLSRLNFNKNQLLYLLEKSNLSHTNKSNSNAIMMLIANNKQEGLNFTNNEIIEIIKKDESQLLCNNIESINVFFLALLYNETENINFDFEQLNYIYEKSNINDKEFYGNKNIDMIQDSFTEFLEKRKILLEKKQIIENINFNKEINNNNEKLFKL